MDILHDLQGWAGSTIEDTAEGAFRDARVLREIFLRHVLIFHQLFNSVFHIRSHRDEKGLKSRLHLSICKVKSKNRYLQM